MKDIKYEIVLGLNDKQTGNCFDLSAVEKEIESFFKDYEINFSLNEQIGGYIHDDGTYVIEHGIKITIVGEKSKQQEKNFYAGLKKRFNQESVLIIKSNINQEFVRL